MVEQLRNTAIDEQIIVRTDSVTESGSMISLPNVSSTIVAPD